MSNCIILAPDSQVYQAFEAATSKRMVFFTGLSGVGKSLYIQQFSKMAQRAGRTIHLLQWDITREAFQNDESLQQYPEVDGVTHCMIRKAVGIWTRKGLQEWHQQYPGEEHILIGELPLIGNRLVEVVQQHMDSVETLLASDQAQFFLPVPSKAVRDHIVGCRTQSIDSPNHQREAGDAPPSVVNAHWQEIRQIAITLNFAKSDCSKNYDPAIYTAAYEHLLQHRNSTTLPITEILDTQGSVYEVGEICSELAATQSEAREIFAELESQYALQEIEAMTEHWHQL